MRYAITSLLFLTIFKNTKAYWETILSDSLTDYQTFEKYWDYLYPWGSGKLKKKKKKKKYNYYEKKNIKFIKLITV